MSEQTNPFIRALDGLQRHDCKYCAIGGFAAVLYGIQRFTPDINIVLELTSENLGKFINFVNDSGLEVEAGQTLDSTEDLSKLLSQIALGRVSFSDVQAPGFQIQVFWGLPLSFDQITRDLSCFEFEGVSMKVCSLDVLIDLKAKSSRNQDKYEAALLAALHKLNTKIEGFDTTSAELSLEHDIVNYQIFKSEPIGIKLEWLQLVLTQLGGFCVL